tara:strand:- start:66 stop:215 length:150 start_codon:yes stop_codon:yes gene_type:complete
LGLYWEYNGTKMGMRLKIYRREEAGNETEKRFKIKKFNKKLIIKNFTKK